MSIAMQQPVAANRNNNKIYQQQLSAHSPPGCAIFGVISSPAGQRADQETPQARCQPPPGDDDPPQQRTPYKHLHLATSQLITLHQHPSHPTLFARPRICLAAARERKGHRNLLKSGRQSPSSPLNLARHHVQRCVQSFVRPSIGLIYFAPSATPARNFRSAKPQRIQSFMAPVKHDDSAEPYTPLRSALHRPTRELSPPIRNAGSANTARRCRIHMTMRVQPERVIWAHFEWNSAPFAVTLADRPSSPCRCSALLTEQSGHFAIDASGSHFAPN